MDTQTGSTSVFLVTGDPQGGKTAFLSELVQELMKNGLHIRGFLCPGRIENGERTEFTLQDVNTGQAHPMASVQMHPGWFKYRRFWFNPEAFSEGKSWVLNSLEHRPQIVVIDEVGPMELEGSGWTDCLNALIYSRVPLQLWSVRTPLVDQVRQRWDIPPGHRLSINSVETGQAAELILELLKNKRIPS